MVETYIESELQDLITDAEKTEEWKQKIEELGLSGQSKLIEGKKSPLPFPLMNKEMANVYQTLCPSSVEIKGYDRTTIPSRVLEMVGLCFKENYFKSIDVWFNEVKPDPILVGSCGNEHYLIARWGDELRSFSELKQLARQRKIDEEKTELQRRLATLENDVDKYFSGDWVHFIS